MTKKPIRKKGKNKKEVQLFVSTPIEIAARKYLNMVEELLWKKPIIKTL